MHAFKVGIKSCRLTYRFARQCVSFQTIPLICARTDGPTQLELCLHDHAHTMLPVEWEPAMF